MNINMNSGDRNLLLGLVVAVGVAMYFNKGSEGYSCPERCGK